MTSKSQMPIKDLERLCDLESAKIVMPESLTRDELDEYVALKRKAWKYDHIRRYEAKRISMKQYKNEIDALKELGLNEEKSQ